MRTRIALSTMGFLGILMVEPAFADSIIYSNGILTGSTAACDSGPQNCSGSGTWTVFDDFTLASDATVSGFTVGGIITRGGTPDDYISTDWSLWDQDPFAEGASPLASGNAVATITQVQGLGLLPRSFFRVSDLAVPLDANTTYWLGASHIFALDPSGPASQPGTVRLRASGNNIEGFKQADSAGLQREWGSDTFFTIRGTAESPAPVPEPASLLLVGSGLGGVIVRTVKRRRSRSTGGRC